MLQQVTPDGFTVVFRTSRPTHAWLDVARDGRVSKRVPALRQEDQYVATVTDLASGKTYRYRIGLSRGVHRSLSSESWKCRTDPGPTASFRFVAFGDSGTGELPQSRLAAQMLQRHPDLVIHTGDLIYDDGDPGDYPAKFFEPYAKLIASAPFMPVVGNHDYRTDRGAPLLEAFVLPRNGPPQTDPERHYWFDFGCARFAAIDTDVEKAEVRDYVAAWVKRSFATAGGRWRFAYFHHPPYTACTKHAPNEAVQRLLVPALEESGVDLVFCGHNHLYERSKPILAGKVVREGEGIVYIVTGAGGARRYPLKPPRERPDYLAAGFDADFSFTVVEASPVGLTLEQVDLKGDVVDRWDLRRPPRAASSRPATTSVGATAGL
jgi:hypothetical protein